MGDRKGIRLVKTSASKPRFDGHLVSRWGYSRNYKLDTKMMMMMWWCSV